MQKDDDKMIKLEFICEELNEQLKLILELISRYKQKRPHLKEKIQCEKTIMVSNCIRIIHDRP